MKRLAIAALALLWLSAWPAGAWGGVPPADAEAGRRAYVIWFVVFLVAVAPSEYGALLPAHGPADGATFDLGWSGQFPMPLGAGPPTSRHHRIVVGLDYFPTGVDPHVDGRFGYRYDRRHLFAGLAAGSDHGRFIWSPEVGVKLVNFAPTTADVSPSLHLLVRGNVAPEVNALRSVTVLLGWSVF